ncbi:FYN-binding protein 1-like [Centruroides vittatus]|uniref:FYN-binding protein 1-like n=1 Tax=Centruroides vittatus TaxID=120091 RepID=UPI00350F2B68
MTETISRGNVQALRNFFAQHFESMKANTQPRNKNQKSKNVKSSASNLSTSKQDIRNLDIPSISRSLSVFDLPNNVKLPAFCKNQKTTNKSNEESVKNREVGLDSLSNDSGVEENYESSPSGDCRQSSIFQNRLCSESYSSDCENDNKSPTVNIIKPSPIKHENSLKRTDNQRNVMTVWNRTYEVDINQEIEKRLFSSPQKLFYSEVFINNNYVCKAQYKRTKLPPLDVLGPPPPKPVKPSNITVSFPLKMKCNIEKPLISKKPSRLPPPPPLPSANKIEQITATDVTNNSTGCYNNRKQKQFWRENDLENFDSIWSGSEIGKNELSPPILPPKKFSYHLPQNKNENFSDNLLEELYQDTQVNDDKIYEEMPFSNYEFQVYNKGRKRSKSQRELLKDLQKEQKEQERRERELDKRRKKFGLTGDEIPLDKGYVKNDRKGSQNDLTVKKGDILLILRMENNPVGRWLVQNDKGKIGYVELDNIKMDANSIKTVMKERRSSMGSKDGRTYSVSSSEAVYEEAC